jgi:hypothetical protein
MSMSLKSAQARCEMTIRADRLYSISAGELVASRLCQVDGAIRELRSLRGELCGLLKQDDARQLPVKRSLSVRSPATLDKPPG